MISVVLLNHTRPVRTGLLSLAMGLVGSEAHVVIHLELGGHRLRHAPALNILLRSAAASVRCDRGPVLVSRIS